MLHTFTLFISYIVVINVSLCNCLGSVVGSDILHYCLGDATDLSMQQTLDKGLLP